MGAFKIWAENATVESLAARLGLAQSPRWIARAAHVQGREPFGVSGLAGVEVGLDRAPRLTLRYVIMGCGD
jgi:hypothetical protein